MAKTLLVRKLRKTKKRNPVHFMDSVDALDLLQHGLLLLRTERKASLEFLDQVREQIQRHRIALRNTIGHESL